MIPPPPTPPHPTPVNFQCRFSYGGRTQFASESTDPPPPPLPPITLTPLHPSPPPPTQPQADAGSRPIVWTHKNTAYTGHRNSKSVPVPVARPCGLLSTSAQSPGPAAYSVPVPVARPCGLLSKVCQSPGPAAYSVPVPVSRPCGLLSPRLYQSPGPVAYRSVPVSVARPCGLLSQSQLVPVARPWSRAYRPFILVNPFTAPACTENFWAERCTYAPAKSILSDLLTRLRTFNDMRFDENPFTCQSEKEDN